MISEAACNSRCPGIAKPASFVLILLLDRVCMQHVGQSQSLQCYAGAVLPAAELASAAGGLPAGPAPATQLHKLPGCVHQLYTCSALWCLLRPLLNGNPRLMVTVNPQLKTQICLQPASSQDSACLHWTGVPACGCNAACQTYVLTARAWGAWVTCSPSTDPIPTHNAPEALHQASWRALLPHPPSAPYPQPHHCSCFWPN